MRRTRILIAGTSIPTCSYPSDKEFVWQLALQLSKSWDVSLFSVGETSPTTKQLSESLHYRSVLRMAHRPMGPHGMRVAHPTHSAVRGLAETWVTVMTELARELRRAVRRGRPYDVVHFADHVGPVAPWMRRMSPTSVLTGAKPSVQLPAQPHRRMAYQFLQRASYQHLDHVVAFSEAAAVALMALGVRPCRISNIPWGIVPPDNSPGNDEVEAIRKEYAQTTSGPFVVMADREVHTQRGPKLVQEAQRIASSAGITLHLFVRPQRFTATIQGFQTSHVRIHPSPKDYSRVLAAATAYLDLTTPQDRTAMPPLAWLEAMAAGAVPIVRDGPGVSEFVKDGETGFVVSSHMQVSSSLVRLNDPAVANAMSQSTRSFVLREHRIDTIARRYFAMWTPLLQRRQDHSSSATLV